VLDGDVSGLHCAWCNQRGELDNLTMKS